MKKITLTLLTFVLFTFASYAQLPAAGYYRLQVLGDFESDNLVAMPRDVNSSGQQPIFANPIDLNDPTQVFQLTYTGELYINANGDALDVINLSSIVDLQGTLGAAGNIEVANNVTDGVRNITNGSGRANLRGATTAGNEAGEFDNFYLESTTPGPNGEQVFRIRVANDVFDGNRRLSGANSNSGQRFINFGGFTSVGNDRFIFIEDTNVDPTALSTATVSSSDFFVSNPVNDVLTIKGLTSNLVSVSVYNVLGNQVSSVSANGKSIEINTASYAAGMYIVKIVSDNGTFSTKVVKL